jgi:hypothetical protein
MQAKLPAFSLSELFKFGLVPTLSVVIGLLFVSFGVRGDLSASNAKLVLGVCVICFGIMWHSGATWVKFGLSNLRLRHVFPCALFFVLFLLFGYAFLAGHFPPVLMRIISSLRGTDASR